MMRGSETPAMGKRLLPPLIIKTFDGNVTQWKLYYESFKAAVHESNLSNIEKFNYLKSFLKGNALQVIDGLALTNENYEAALKLLQERFGNETYYSTSYVGIKQPTFCFIR